MKHVLQWLKASVIAIVVVFLSWRALSSLLFWGLLLAWGSGPVEDQVRFTVPGTKVELVHYRHLSAMCEFHRDITIISEGKPATKFQLRYDTAGGYPINCYLIQTPSRILLRMDDRVAGHLLDLTEQKIYAVIRYQGGLYFGEYQGEFVSYGWGMVDSDPSTLLIHIGDQTARPISEFTEGVKEQYVGCLGGGLGYLKFYSSEEVPEPKIDHLYDD